MRGGFFIFFQKRVSTAIALSIIVFCAVIAGILILNRLQQIAMRVPPIFVSHIPKRMMEEQFSTSSTSTLP